MTNRVCDHDSSPLEDVNVATHMIDMTNPPDLDEQCRQAYGSDSYHCGGKKVSSHHCGGKKLSKNCYDGEKA